MKNQLKTTLLFTTTLIFSVFLFSCKKETTDNPAPSPHTATFKSLKKGHKWVYDFKYNGTAYDSLVVEIIDEQNGVFEALTYDKTTSETDYRYAEGDFMKIYPKGKTTASAQRVVKSNAVIGETWKDFNGTDTIQTTVKQTALAVTVPAGAFTCLELEIKNLKQKTISYNYTNADVGLVKIFINSNTGGIAIYELKYKNF